MKRIFIIIVFISLALLSCSRKTPLSVNDGSSTVSFQILFHDNMQSLSGIRSLSKSMEITSVVVTVSASDMTTLTKEMTRSEDTFTGTLSVPMGNSRKFQIEALDAADIVQYSGSTTQDISQAEEQVNIQLSGIYPDPVALQISGYSGSSVTLSWSASTATDFGFYRITRTTSNISHDINDHSYTDISSQSTVTFTDENVTPGNTYYYVLWVVDTEGLGYGSSVQTVTTPTYLFKANFQNGWIDSWEKAFIYISDLNGNVWGESEITSSTQTVTFDIPSEFMLYPEYISVTTVVKGDNIHIETNLKNPIGSTWTYKVYPEDQQSSYQGDVTMNFSNVPEHTGFVVSSLWNYQTSTSREIYNPYIYEIYKSPVDVYVKIDINNSNPKYLWLNNASPGEYSVDMNNLQDPQTATITYPSETNGIRGWLYGYPIAGDRYQGSYCVDRQSLIGISAQEIDLVYPSDRFTDFCTSIYEYDISDNYNYWRQTTFGDIPEFFEQINADFAYINTTPENFSIQTSGSFDEIFSTWLEYDIGMDAYIYWDVYGPSDLNTYQLPTFSSKVSEYLVNVNVSDFELQLAEITDYFQIDTYQQLQDIYFSESDYLFNVIPGYRMRAKYIDRSLNKCFDHNDKLVYTHKRKAIY